MSPLMDRYSSPPTGPFRRRLFVDPLDGEPGAASTASSGSSSAPSSAPPAVTKPTQANLVTTIPAGQTVVAVATANGQTVTIPMQSERLNVFE